MPLPAGSRVGGYEIIGAIGAGGMGEVYRARDTRLDRDVALKILPPLFATDPDRLARFERESKTLASLNHTNIAHVYGIEQSGSTHALVMELVEGEDLAGRLERGCVPVDETIRIALQIAEALEIAHEQGIIHRDLKPANIKVRPDGTVKILDFGLAKALGGVSSPAAGPVSENSPTFTSPGMTQAGVVLGTVGYMSPEQARGYPVDRRTDIWAFGAVVFELLTGRPTFGGETVADVLAAVVTREPDWTALPADTPRSLHRLLRRCLEKDPRKRLLHAGDARLLLDEDEDRRIPDQGRDRRTPSDWLQRLPWVLSGVLALSLTGLLMMPGSKSVNHLDARSVGRLSLQLPTNVLLDENAEEHVVLAVSPDGSTVAFVGQSGGGKALFVRRLDAFEATPLPGTEDARSPFFSPDGTWIAFFTQAALKKISVHGGSAIELCSVGLSRGGAWGRDGTIVFSPTSTAPLMRIPQSGGTPTELTSLDPQRNERTHRWPAFLPGGKEIAFTVGTADKPGDYDDSEIAAVDLATGRRRTIVKGASMIRATATGHVIMGRDGQLFSMLAEAAAGGTINSAPILTGVGGVPSSGAVHFDVSETGTLVYAELNPRAKEHELAWLGTDGRLEPLPLPLREYQSPRLSPDGTKIAVSVGPGRGRQSATFVYDLTRGSLTRIPFDSPNAMSPIWTPDGRRVTVAMTRPAGDAVASRAADGSGPEELHLSFNTSAMIGVLAWSPDERSLLLQRDNGAQRAYDLMTWSRGDQQPRDLLANAAVQLQGALSPDGAWLAYVTNEFGRFTVQVQAFPVASGRWQVSESGFFPRWSVDGRQLYYIDGSRLMSVAISTTPTFSFSAPKLRAEIVLAPSADQIADYDVAKDGRLLIVRRVAAAAGETHLNVVLNWADELRRAAAR